jgi:pullulanase
MHKLLPFFAIGAALLCSVCSPKTNPASTNTAPKMNFDQYPAYSGNDLGMHWTAQQSVFKLWSPAVEATRLHLYNNGEKGKPGQTISLQKDNNGVWSATLPGNLKGQYYTVQVKHNGQWLPESPDPYAKAVGVNGKRAMIIDLNETNPDGWANDMRPPLKQFSDVILYELHMRDLSAHPNSGIKNTGKFLALTEYGTKNAKGLSTGLDHIKSLGVTHVHLLPSFDYRYTSVDETRLNEPQFNWGYDPENYNVPEGSYSTNPYDGAVRIREFKQAIKTLHSNGLRVVLDVVYNHTGATNESVFNRCVPGYYYRQNPDGSFSNASACGNETASERAMMRQYIVESVKYWAKEYHIDGFRFDLMGIHDIETMNQVSDALYAIDPTIFIYGEGWTAGASPLPDSLKAIKAHTHQLRRIAAFSDDFRDALKGSVFNHTEKGFVSGRTGQEESIKFGIVGAIKHPQVDYSKVNYSKAPWTKEPYQAISYAECHDNHTLWDRLLLSNPEASEEDRIKMYHLALSMVFTSQGVPFIQAGMEMLRTKGGAENSFNAPDEVNRMDWDRKTTYAATVDFTQKLIQLRKNHPAFRLGTADLVRRHLKFLEAKEPQIIAYQLGFNAGNDPWTKILVIHNANNEMKFFELPKGNWTVVMEENQINEKGIRSILGTKVNVPAISTMILVE